MALDFSIPPPPLPEKLTHAPPAGIIGREDRVPLAEFRPDAPERFPGWEEVQASVVRISCNGIASGGGVLIEDGARMISAAHVFLDNDGSRNPYSLRCQAVHPGGDVVDILHYRMKSGRFTIPEALGDHFSVAITAEDWVVVPLARAPQGATGLPVLSQEDAALSVGTPVLNIAGPQDNYETDGFVAQVCTYHGAPPTASHLEGTEIVGRLAEPGDEWRVARYDCDLGRGGSGSPVIGWHEGTPHLWGIMTDSLRGAERCPEVGYVTCYSAGPLVTGMDLID